MDIEEHPDRPLECTDCKRPIKVHYTEMVGDIVHHTSHCDSCPALQRKLCKAPETASPSDEGMSDLVCGECGTTMQTVRMGNGVGCAMCYDVFNEIITNELILGQKIPKKAREQAKTLPLHIGRSPGEVQEISPSIRLLALNEALTDTLKREDYEQAALLRDQIKSLTEGKKNGKGK